MKKVKFIICLSLVIFALLGTQIAFAQPMDSEFIELMEEVVHELEEIAHELEHVEEWLRVITFAAVGIFLVMTGQLIVAYLAYKKK